MLALSRPPEAAAPAFVMDRARFAAWLRTAQPGSPIEYHRGHLCVDRQQKIEAPDNAPENKARAVLNRLADQAMRASQQGLVHLVQRHHGPADFSYIAIKSQSSVKVGRFAKTVVKKQEERET